MERCGALADWAMEAKCGVVLKWWSVLDAHKTRAVGVRSSTGVALCEVMAMFAHTMGVGGAYRAAEEHGGVWLF